MLKKELEIGKTYIDASGENVTIVSNDGDGVYPYISEDGDSFTKDGLYSVASGDSYQPWNLVREVNNDPVCIDRSTIQSQIDAFLLEENNTDKTELYTTDRENSDYVLNKFRDFIFKVDIEKKARRRQYEELKKEFEG